MTSLLTSFVILFYICLNFFYNIVLHLSKYLCILRTSSLMELWVEQLVWCSSSIVNCPLEAKWYIIKLGYSQRNCTNFFIYPQSLRSVRNCTILPQNLNHSLILTCSWMTFLFVVQYTDDNEEEDDDGDASGK
jgi:hypothetical protein